MKPTYRRIFIFVATIVVLAGAYLGYSLLAASQSNKVPQEFSEARAQGAVISENIVASSNDIATSLAKLSNTTSTYLRVSSTIDGVNAKVDEVRGQALKLADTLGAMTRSLSGIRPAPAQQAAYRSITQSVNLVTHLITYTDEVKRLTAAIETHLRDNTKNSVETARLVREINVEIAAINSYSRSAKEAMDEFDSLLR